MTTEERFARIEHVIAGLAEERRRDREENRALWRDTQRQIDLLATETRAADRRIQARLEEFIAEARPADARLHARIEEVNDNLSQRIADLVSAIGQFLADGRQTR